MRGAWGALRRAAFDGSGKAEEGNGKGSDVPEHEIDKAAFGGSSNAEQGKGKGSGAPEDDSDDDDSRSPSDTAGEKGGLRYASDTRVIARAVAEKVAQAEDKAEDFMAGKSEDGAQPGVECMESALSDVSVAASDLRWDTAELEEQALCRGQPELERIDTFEQSNTQPPATQCIHRVFQQQLASPKYVETSYPACFASPSQPLAAAPSSAPPTAPPLPAPPAVPPAASGPAVRPSIERWASTTDSETEASQALGSRDSASKAPGRLSSEADQKRPSSSAPQAPNCTMRAAWGALQRAAFGGSGKAEEGNGKGSDVPEHEIVKAASGGSSNAEEGKGKGSGAPEDDSDDDDSRSSSDAAGEKGGLRYASDTRVIARAVAEKVAQAEEKAEDFMAGESEDGAQPGVERMESALSDVSVAASDLRWDTFEQSNTQPPATQCIHLRLASPEYVETSYPACFASPSQPLAAAPSSAPPAAPPLPAPPAAPPAPPAPPAAPGPAVRPSVKRCASCTDSQTEGSQVSASTESASEAPSRLSSGELAVLEDPGREPWTNEELGDEPWTNEVIQANHPEMDRSYSSVLKGDAVGTGHARSRLDSPQAWSALRDEVGEWMQIDLGSELQVWGVITQGSAQPSDDQHVTKFKVSFSADGVAYSRVGDVFASGQSTHGERYTIPFPKAIAARYVCFNVEEWREHIAMRAGVLAQIDAPGKWPRVDTEPLCEYLENNRRVLARWLVRAKRMLREGSTEQRKLSQCFEVRLNDEVLNFQLKLMATSKGTGRQMSGFGKAEGCGRVQVMLDRELPPNIPALQVRIAAGRGATATAWQPRGRPEVEVAKMKGSKPCFELSGVDWNFKSAQDKDANQHLAIVVELSLGSA